jgi:hypothetical protein
LNDDRTMSIVKLGASVLASTSPMAECPEQTPEGELASRVPVLLPIAFHGFGHIPNNWPLTWILATVRKGLRLDRRTSRCDAIAFAEPSVCDRIPFAECIIETGLRVCPPEKKAVKLG